MKKLYVVLLALAFVASACQLGGGVCDYDDLAQAYLCTGGSEHGQACMVPTEDACASGGGTCFDGQCAGGRYDGTACCIDGRGVCQQSEYEASRTRHHPRHRRKTERDSHQQESGGAGLSAMISKRSEPEVNGGDECE